MKETRIGVIVVHGIGEQGRFEHLEETVRELAAPLRQLGKNRVSISVRSGTTSSLGAARDCRAEDGGPAAEIVIRDIDGNSEVRLCFHEVWWGDITDPPSLVQPFRFLFWGFAMWAVRLKHLPPGCVKAGLIEPDAQTSRWRTQAEARGRLFFTGYLVAALGLLLWPVIFIVRRFASGVPDLVGAAVSYMSDIRLFTQPTPPPTVPLDMLGEPARFGIHARMVRTMVDVAIAKDGYARWYVLAHSLGSVVAFRGLMTPGEVLPRYLDEARWRKIEGGDLKQSCGGAATFPLPPTAPAWLPADACINRVKLFNQFSGFVTYGCPLDKFATLWPGLVPQLLDPTPLEDRPWFNVYDPTDPVAGQLDYFGKSPIDKFAPINISYAASRVPLLSHIRYLRDASAGRFADGLARMLSAPEPVEAEGSRLLTDMGGKAKKQRGLYAWLVWIVVAFLAPALTAWILPFLPGWPWFEWLPSHWLVLAASLAIAALFVVLLCGCFSRMLADEDFTTSDLSYRHQRFKAEPKPDRA